VSWLEVSFPLRLGEDLLANSSDAQWLRRYFDEVKEPVRRSDDARPYVELSPRFEAAAVHHVVRHAVAQERVVAQLAQLHGLAHAGKDSEHRAAIRHMLL
jgi:hypothetical protein